MKTCWVSSHPASPTHSRASPHTDLGVVIEQQVMGTLVASSIVGTCALVPLDDNCTVGGRGAAMAAKLHHGAHTALTAILLAPLPVYSAYHTHAHLHTCVGIQVHGEWGCSRTCNREHAQSVSKCHTAKLIIGHALRQPPGGEGWIRSRENKAKRMKKGNGGPGKPGEQMAGAAAQS